MFKELGYRLPEDLKDSDDATYLDQGAFPISTLLVGRPFDKKSRSKESDPYYKVRAFHEVEIFIAGSVGKDFSGMVEIEAEDENNFKVEFGLLAANYNFSKELNFQLVWGPTFWSDPYGLIANQFRLTRGKVALISQKFGGKSGITLNDNAQNVIATGRIAERLFYSAGISGRSGDAEGEDAENIHLRLAYDIRKDIMLGLFALQGKQKIMENDIMIKDLEFSRIGLDFKANYGNTYFQGAYLVAADDKTDGAGNTVSGEDKNNAFTFQMYHILKKGKTKKPLFVPLLRYDSFESNDGDDTSDEITLNVSYYLKENAKAYVEYWKQLSVPGNASKKSRATVQVQVGF